MIRYTEQKIVVFQLQVLLISSFASLKGKPINFFSLVFSNLVLFSLKLHTLLIIFQINCFQTLRQSSVDATNQRHENPKSGVAA